MSKSYVPIRVDVYSKQIITAQTPLMQEGLHLLDSTSKGIPHVMNQTDVDVQLGKQIVDLGGLALHHPHTVEEITLIFKNMCDKNQHTKFNIPYIVMINIGVYNQFMDQMNGIGFKVKIFK